MSFIDCLGAKAKDGTITKAQLRQLENDYNQMFSKFRENMGDVEAASQAAREIVRSRKSVMMKKKRNSVNGARLLDMKRKAFEAEVKATGVKLEVLVGDLMQQASQRRDSLFRLFASAFETFAGKYESKWAGLVQRTDGIENVVLEMMGKSTGDSEAAVFGKALRDVFDLAHAKYTSSGGIMGKIKNYFPQVHNGDLIRDVSFDDWSKYLLDRIDADQMIDLDTGLPFAHDKLIDIMQKNYDEITSRGKKTTQDEARARKSKIGHGTELSGRRQASRFYIFKDPESFLEYNNKFGSGKAGLFDATMSHLDMMARDTGILQAMGPTPNSLIRNLIDDVPSVNAKSKLKGDYDIITGFTDSMAGESWWSNGASNMRSLFSSAYLGSAFISSLSDPAWAMAASKVHGLSSMGTFKHFMKMLNPLDSTHRDMARQMGFLSEHLLQRSLHDMRMTGGSMGGPLLSFASQFVNRAGFLHRWTKMTKDSVSFELFGTLRRMSESNATWEGIDEVLRDSLFAHGVGRKEWDFIKKADLWDAPNGGGKYLRPEEVALVKDVTPEAIEDMKKLIVARIEDEVKRDLITDNGGVVTKKRLREVTEARIKNENVDKLSVKQAEDAAYKYALDVSERLEDFNQTMRALAANEPTVRAQTYVKGGWTGADARRGTALRVGSDAVMQFKSFPITVMMNQLAPIISGRKAGGFGGSMSKAARWKQAGWVSVGAGLFGAVSLQMQQFIKGKDFHDMDYTNVSFWGAAWMKAGGAGLAGDFFFKDYSRFGRDPVTESLGPTVGFMTDFMKTTKGSIDRSMDGDAKRGLEAFNRNVFQLIRRNIPAQNLWYTRAFAERNLFDPIEKAIDPKFDKRMRNQEKKMMRETGQKYFWARGESVPERAPEISERPE